MATQSHTELLGWNSSASMPQMLPGLVQEGSNVGLQGLQRISITSLASRISLGVLPTDYKPMQGPALGLNACRRLLWRHGPRSGNVVKTFFFVSQHKRLRHLAAEIAKTSQKWPQNCQVNCVVQIKCIVQTVPSPSLI